VFANRILDKLNVLPDSCMECTTLNAFKRKLKLLMELETQIQVRQQACKSHHTALKMICNDFFGC